MKRIGYELLAFFLFSGCVKAWGGENVRGIDAASAGRFAALTMKCIPQEYPNIIQHMLNSDEDVKKPKELTPAFFGCYDWHSAVHGHWLLARLVRTFPGAPFVPQAVGVLETTLTPEKISAEIKYMEGSHRETFERPYGLSWLLQLSAELRESDDVKLRALSERLKPLEKAAISRLNSWIPKLSYPIRTGEHHQTAFAFGLILDWARSTGDAAAARLIESKTRELYLNDKACPLEYEPSGEDFLSPCLAEADLVRRVLPKDKYSVWLKDFLPVIPEDGSANWLKPAVVTDPSDGRLAHLDGLNLSRAWMLEGIAGGLPQNDKRKASLKAAASANGESGIKSITGEHYEGGHWLGTFAVYLVTGRGL